MLDVPAGSKRMDVMDKKSTSADLIHHRTAVAGFGSDFGAVFPAGATPLSATASKNCLMTALPRRRFDSEI